MMQTANAETIFVTKEYFDAEEDKLREQETRLAEANAEKNGAYQSDTNTWHDNFAYENAARIVAMLKAEARQLSESLKTMVLRPNDNAAAPQKAGIWTFVKIKETDLETSKETEKIVGIAPVGGENFDKQIYNYRAPIVSPLLGAKVGDVMTIKIPRGEFRIEVLEIMLLK
jgi:transcription elongation factor GreA